MLSDLLKPKSREEIIKISAERGVDPNIIDCITQDEVAYEHYLAVVTSVSTERLNAALLFAERYMLWRKVNLVCG